MNIRLIHLGRVSPIRSQAIYHGLAQEISDNDDPILVVVRPDSPYICVGMHQNIEKEINESWCCENSIPIIRRSVGGGTVLLDQNQLFFQYIFPKNKITKRPSDLYKALLPPIIDCYQELGCSTACAVDNDIHINHKKICGTGAASIEDATVFVGSFLFDFDHDMMANAITTPSNEFKTTFSQLMAKRMTTIAKELEKFPTEEMLIKLLSQHTEKRLGLKSIDSALTEKECQSIVLAEQEINENDWINQGGKRLIQQGIKVAAHTYLVEGKYTIQKHNLSIRILLCDNHIETIWFSGNKVSKQLKEIQLLIYRNKPSQHNLNDILKDTPELLEAINSLLGFQPY